MLEHILVETTAATSRFVTNTCSSDDRTGHSCVLPYSKCYGSSDSICSPRVQTEDLPAWAGSHSKAGAKKSGGRKTNTCTMKSSRCFSGCGKCIGMPFVKEIQAQQKKHFSKSTYGAGTSLTMLRYIETIK